MPINFTVGLIGPGKLRLSIRSSDGASQAAPIAGTMPSNSTFYANLSTIVAAGQGPDIRKVGPGKLRLPPRDYGFPSLIFTQATVGAITKPGPGVSPNSRTQFFTPPRSTAIPGIFVNIAGIMESNSTMFASLAQKVLVVGMIPQGGPGVQPFNNNQFTMFQFDTSKPSPTNLALAGGVMQSNSTFYGRLTGIGALASVSPQSQSQFLGSLSGVAAGSLSGTMGSSSTFYAQIVGIGELDGVMLSNSLLEMLQVGSGFRPFVPNTPVLDVRSNSGYEPWTVRPGKTIG